MIPGPDSEVVKKILGKMDSIHESCVQGMGQVSREAQQVSIIAVAIKEEELIKLLRRYRDEGLIDSQQVFDALELLLYTTYEFHKLASKQDFGDVIQPKTLPVDSIAEDQLIF